MTKQEQYSNIINSVGFGLLVNNDLDWIRGVLRGCCGYKQYTGELLNTYNKTYQLNDSGLRLYLSDILPQKHMIGFYDYITNT